ncbi:MAG TPA: SEC-C metal-binding domain-containing protein [Anaerolineae bacterium]
MIEELADADAATLREELQGLAADAAEQGRPFTLLAIELHNLLLFLPPLPSVEAIYAARNVAEAREAARTAYTGQLTGLLDRLQAALAEGEGGAAVDEALFREQKQTAVDGTRHAFEVIGRERPGRDQLKQEQRTVERRLSDLGVQVVARCLAGIPTDQLHGLAEALFEQKLALAYVQVGQGNYALLDAGEGRAEDLKSLAELDGDVLRTDLAGIVGQMDAENLAALVADLGQDGTEADAPVWQALARDRNVAGLDDDHTTQLATALFDSLGGEVRAMLAVLSTERLGLQAMREFTQAEMLGAIDTFWPQHLTAMDELREGIGLQAFAQRDPLVEFSRQSFAGFERLLVEIDRMVIDHFFQDLPRYQAIVAQHRESLRMQEQLALRGARVDESGSVRKTGDLGRNDPCWCGSGKKYKYCHMRSDQAKAGAAPAAQAAVTAPAGDGRQAPRGAPAGNGKAGQRQAPPPRGKAGKRR